MNNNKVDGVKLDINDLRGRRDTKDRKISLDDLRYDEMIENQCGRIVNISSASWNGNVGQANYSSAKADRL